MPRLLLSALAALVILSALTAATYAWFTKNKRVESDNVSVKSGTQDLTLEIAPSAGGPFSDISAISKISTGKVLDPVSTVDLAAFWVNTGSEDGVATNFKKTEKGYYYGQVFVRASGEGQADNAKFDLYFDADGVAVSEGGDAAGLLLNAARVGLIFNGTEEAKPLIFSLSDAHNGGDAVTSTDGTVISAAGSPTADPAVDPEIYTITQNGDSISLPEKPLAVLALNQVYTVDVYFYLEGCDRDCTNAIRTTEMSIQLPLYGVLDEEGTA